MGEFSELKLGELCFGLDVPGFCWIGRFRVGVVFLSRILA